MAFVYRRMGCPQSDALGTPQPPAPNYFLDAVQLQFLEDVRVTPPTLYQPVTAVFLKDNRLYLGENYGFTILNVSNPASPLKLSYVPLGGVATGLQVIDQRAYILLERDNNISGGLQILDVRDPQQPIRLGSFLLQGAPANISVSGSFAYVANAELGLQIIDLHDPNHLTLRGSFTPSGATWGIQLAGQLVALTDSGYIAGNKPSSGLQLIDVSDPDHPTLRGTYPLHDGAQELTIEGNYAYLVEEGGLAVDIVDINDPSHPTFLGKYQSNGGASRSWKYSAIWPISYATVSSPSWISAIRHSGLTGSMLADGSDIQVSTRIAYVATWDYGLQVFDVKDPNHPVLLSTYGIPKP